MRTVLLAAAASALVTGSAQAETFVIVHGAFQTAAAWDQVAEALRAGGDEVTLVDLPGRDGTMADGSDIHALTLGAYRDATLAAMGDQSDVVLVGHSFGGFSISAVAEAAPDRIRKLIYVAAYVPNSGESLQSLSGTDKGTKFTGENFVLAQDYSAAEVLPRDRALIFANDVESEAAQAIADALVKEPLAPLGEPITLTEANFGRVPKAYVETLRDNAVSPALQARMIERAGIGEVREIDTGHAPMATEPEELAAILHDLAGG
ncbi:alpha/beta fold hydrolase [Rubellimicrobium roseum]|uniref:Alpha/beta fold hydrolase n=1 Tax=Rubellimicrobium roseum TaxID=687525 RepID=A0A5C4NI39_9RHOB|nr:alpha/beta fold hydrolase [Rubellimicrobium roseum]TNC73108.1 alpha/beta fold hydrolase [Rubellimicrobium roseum]